MAKYNGYAIPYALYKNVLYSVDDAINVFHKTKLGQFTCPKCGDYVTLVCSNERQYFCHSQWGKDHYFCESYSGHKEYQPLKMVRSRMMEERNNWVSYFILVDNNSILNYVSLPSITGNLTKINFKTGLKEYTIKDTYINPSLYEISNKKIDFNIIYSDQNLPVFLECDYRNSIFLYKEENNKYLFKKIVGKLQIGTKYAIFSDKKLNYFSKGIKTELLLELNNKFVYEVEFLENNAFTESFADSKGCVVTKDNKNTNLANHILKYFFKKYFASCKNQAQGESIKQNANNAININKNNKKIYKNEVENILTHVYFYMKEGPFRFHYSFENDKVLIVTSKKTMYLSFDTIVRIKKEGKVLFRDFALVYNEATKPKVNPVKNLHKKR